MAFTGDPPTRLSRRLGLTDAVVVGLGAMVGAGVFAAFAPAAGAAGSGMLTALALAGLVAFANATSSADLAALYPESGGTYAYARHRLGESFGALAGWAFVLGKTASCGAMALALGSYVAPDQARVVAVGGVVAVTSVNLAGVQRSAALTRVLLVLVLAALACVVVACLFGGTADASRITLRPTGGAHGLLQAAAFLFFAFAGYARIATLGEEVRDPRRTIPRAIPVALGAAFVIYLAVGASALAAVGAPVLAAADAPLRAAVEAGSLDGLSPIVGIGAAVASLASLLSLMLGVSRTSFAMATRGDLPRPLSAVHARTGVPHHAELALGSVVILLVLVADLRGVIGFSSFCVLGYYALANASALTLGPEERRWPRVVPVLGLLGCAALGLSLPWRTVAAGAALLVVAMALRAIAHARAGGDPPEPTG